MTALPRIVAGQRRRLVARLLVNGAAQAVAAFSVAWLVRDAMKSSGSISAEVLAGLALAGGAVLGLRVLERVDAERLGQDYVAKVRLRLFDRIAAAPSRQTRQARFGLTMTRMITDLNALKNWVSIGIARAAVAAVSVTGSLCALSVFSVRAAVTAAILVLCGLGGAFLLTPLLRRRVREARRRRGRLAANLGEKIAVVETVRLFDKVGQERRRLRSQSRRLAEAMAQRWQVSALLRSIPDGIFPLGVAAVIVVAGADFTGGRQSRGDLAACLLLLGMIAASLRNVAQAWDYRLAFEEARSRLKVLLSRPRIRDGKDAMDVLADGPASIAFQNVRVEKAFEGVSMAAKAGDRVALIGPSGSGKSTLLQLAVRMFEPDSGRILLDGRPLQRLTLTSLRRSVQLVSPEVPLLRGTVRDNVAFGAREAEPGAIDRVCALCGLDRPDTPLALGLDTQVDEAGRNLPHGLRARIALARALAASPRLLLIDDTAFTIDTEAGCALQRGLAKCEATVIVVARAAEEVPGANRLWDLKQGRVHVTYPSTGEPPLSLVGVAQ